MKRKMLILGLLVISLLVLTSSVEDETSIAQAENPEVLSLEEFTEQGDNFAGQAVLFRQTKEISSSGLGNCFDLDDGKRYLIKGTTGYSHGGSRSDICSPTQRQPQRLAEYYCYDHTNGNRYLAVTFVDCSTENLLCNNGACVKP